MKFSKYIKENGKNALKKKNWQPLLRLLHLCMTKRISSFIKKKASYVCS